MIFLRVVWRLLAIAAVCSLGVITLLIEKARGSLRPGQQVARENRIVRRWARQMNRVMGIRVRVVGTPPAAPFLMVANHLSYTDVGVFMSQLDARLLSKAEVKSWAAGALREEDDSTAG